MTSPTNAADHEDAALGREQATKRQISRAIMLNIQFADIGHWIEVDGEPMYQSSSRQIRELERVCDEAADAVIALFKAGA